MRMVHRVGGILSSARLRAEAVLANNDSVDSYAGAPTFSFDPRTNDFDPKGGGLTITAASVASGGGSVSRIDGNTRLSITPPNTDGTQVINYTVQDIGGVTSSGTVTVTVYEPLEETGLDTFSATEGGSQDWYGFSFDDSEGDPVQGLFTGGKNSVLIRESGDGRITITDNNPVADDSGGGFVATASFSATDDLGQSAGPVDVIFTVRESLSVNPEGLTGTIETIGLDTIEVDYDGPATLYDGTYTLDPNTVIDSAPALWGPTAIPKIDSNTGYPGLWYNDRGSGGTMSLAYEWLDDGESVVDSGTVTPSTDWTQPGTAVVLKVTATDTNGSTVARSDDLADAVPDQFIFTDQTNVTIASANVTSNKVTITGIDTNVTASISGDATGEFQVYDTDGTTVVRAWDAGNATVTNNQQIEVRLDASGSFSTTSSVILTVGGVSDTFSVTTENASATDWVITDNVLETIASINSSGPIEVTDNIITNL